MAGDKRWRGRAAKQEGPRWPLAYALALAGSPIGVLLVPMPEQLVAAVVIDPSGQLLEVRRLSPAFMVRWCLNRHLRIFHGLGDLVCALQAGRVVGWLPGRMIERKNGREWLAPAGPFVYALPEQGVEFSRVELDCALA